MSVLSLWPQALVALLLVGIVAGGFVRHGKPTDAKPINGMVILWIAFTFAAVLGAGGFWG